ncbi:hypothetical protein LAT59_02635 [Candidatus Gracilibacteria bacterium]|nr:hypothetical protein [Candidatus Gracilibacteria bacterium]
MNIVVSPKTLSEAKNLLTTLRVYDDMQKKLGKRGVSLFHRIQSGTHLCRVEYHTSLGSNEAFSQALKLYERIFGYTPSKEEIVLRENDSLGGGMKMYFDDSLLDMSFKRVEKKFQK